MNAHTLLVTKRFRVEEITQSLPGGGTTTRQIVRHPGAVTVIPLVDDSHVCLIHNYRVAVGERLIELPAGTLEPDEPPEQTAQRELVEETGYEAGRIRKLHAFYLSPGILDEQMHLYLAQDLRLVGAAREPGEDIQNLIVPWPEAVQMVFRGEIRDAKTIVGLLFYQQLREGSPP